MVISEKQIMQLMEYLRDSLDDDLTDEGRLDAFHFIKEIIEQQSEELIDVTSSDGPDEISACSVGGGDGPGLVIFTRI